MDTDASCFANFIGLALPIPRDNPALGSVPSGWIADSDLHEAYHAGSTHLNGRCRHKPRGQALWEIDRLVGLAQQFAGIRGDRTASACRHHATGFHGCKLNSDSSGSHPVGIGYWTCSTESKYSIHEAGKPWNLAPSRNRVMYLSDGLPSVSLPAAI